MTTTADRAPAASSAAPRFAAAAHHVLTYLHDRFGFALWMLSRFEGDHYIVLDAVDGSYGVAAGTVFRWSDSLCSLMVEGVGPQVAPVVSEVPAYRAQIAVGGWDVGAYVGIPIEAPGGEVFGTLCGLDPQVQPPELVDELPQLQLFARLLRDILEADLEAQRDERDAEQAEGLDWGEFLRREEDRCRRLGSPATIAVVDVDPEDVEMAEHAMRTAVRRQDVIAPLGGGRFGVVAVDAGADISEGIVQRLTSALRIAGVPATVGSAIRHPAESLEQAWQRAIERSEGKRVPVMHAQENTLAEGARTQT
jgi:diguanylate cyclase